MVFNITFNNISIISWLSVLLVEETGVLGEPPPHYSINSDSPLVNKFNQYQQNKQSPLILTY